jgi:hypothetical protein
MKEAAAPAATVIAAQATNALQVEPGPSKPSFFSEAKRWRRFGDAWKIRAGVESRAAGPVRWRKKLGH